jgi:hypothetical protein
LMYDDPKATSAGIADLVSIWAWLQSLNRDGGEYLSSVPGMALGGGRGRRGRSGGHLEIPSLSPGVSQG